MWKLKVAQKTSLNLFCFFSLGLKQPPVVKLPVLCSVILLAVSSLILISCQNPGWSINSFLTYSVTHLFSSVVWMKSNLCLNADLIEHVF